MATTAGEDADGVVAEGCEYADFGGAEHCACIQDAFAFADVLTGGADVVADGDLIVDGDFAEGCGRLRGAASRRCLRRELRRLRHRDGAPVMMRIACPGVTATVGSSPAAIAPATLRCYGGVGRCAAHVGCLKSVAVHGGVVERRDVVICKGVQGEHLPDWRLVREFARLRAG